MTHKVTVRFGGAVDSEVHDYSDRVRLLGDGTPLIHGGMSCDNGSASMGELILDDEQNDIPHRTDPPGLQLAAHNQLIWSEDSPGYESWLSIGRIDNKNVGRPYERTADVNRQWTVQWADANIDLDGLTLTEDWVRPEETDVDRVLAAIAAFCNGSPRLTTVFETHLVSSSGAVTMPAKTYEAGTELPELFDDCATQAGKTYSVVIHDQDSASHTCFLYIDEEDHLTYPCTLSISDQVSEVDGETVFEPHWRQGGATLEQGQELVTGLVSRYGADTTATAVVTDTDHVNAYDYWVKPYNDDQAVTAAQAETRATAMLHARWTEHLTHQPSILIPARLHYLIKAGMSIDVKSAAMMGGQYLGTVQTRRIANVEWAHAGWTDEPWLWANLQLDRTPRKLPLSTGKTQPAATTPKPPDQGTPGTPGTAPTVEREWNFETNALDDAGDSLSGWGTTAGRATTASDLIFPGGGAQAAHDGAWCHTGFSGANTTMPATADTLYTVSAWLRFCQSQTGRSSSATFAWLDVGGTVLRTDTLAATADLSTTFQSFSKTVTSPAGTHDVRIFMNTGYPNAMDFDEVVVASGGTDAVPAVPGDLTQLRAPGSAGPDGELCDSNKYMPLCTALPAQSAADTPYDGTASGLTATSVQNAIDELDANAAGGGGTDLSASGSPADLVNDSTYNAFPSVARLPNGDLLMVYRTGSDHAAALDGVLKAKISTDDGATWGSASTVWDHATLDLRDPAVRVMSTGTIIVSTTTADGDAITDSFFAYTIRGTYDGSTLTWGTPTAVGSTFGTGLNTREVGGSPPLELPDGTILLPIAGRLSADTTSTEKVIVLSSTDDGVTYGSEVTVASNAGNFYTEPFLIRLADGTLHMLLRENDDELILRTTSTDDGATWAAVATAFDGKAKPAHIQVQSGGLLYVSRADPNGDTIYRESADYGVTWTAETVLDATGTRNLYADIVQLDFYRYGVAYGVENSTSDGDIRWEVFTDAANLDILRDLFQRGSEAAATDLDGLSDVVITSPTAGDTLGYDGSNFVNVQPTHYEPLAVSDGAGGFDPVYTADGRFIMVPVGD